MPNEPEREIEKTLRACAQQRREASGAPKAIHPATRRLLQGEVARTYSRGRGDAGFSAQKFRFSWPKWVGIVGAILLLGWVGSVFLLGSRKTSSEYQLAKNKAYDQFAPSPAAAKADAYADSFKDEKTAVPDSSLNRSRRLTGTAQAHSSNSENHDLSISGGAARDLKPELPSTNLDALLAAKSLSVSPLPVPTVSYDGTTPRGSVMTDFSNAPGNVVTLQFASVNQNAAAKKSADLLAVPRALNSFRVEQTGDQIRVIDSDGSVYTGYVENAEAGVKTPASLAEDKSRRAGAATKDSERLADRKPGLLAGTATNTSPAQVAQSFFFRVSGTNLTLHQELVFSGHFVGDATLPAATPPPMANGSVSNEPSAAPAPAPLQLSNCRVSGRAAIGSTNQLEINAQATTNRQH